MRLYPHHLWYNANLTGHVKNKEKAIGPLKNLIFFKFKQKHLKKLPEKILFVLCIFLRYIRIRFLPASNTLEPDEFDGTPLMIPPRFCIVKAVCKVLKARTVLFNAGCKKQLISPKP